VHVSDLADAHVAALDWLAAGEGSSSFNLGNRQGFSDAMLFEQLNSSRDRQLKQKCHRGDRAIRHC
jgi:UDP-glucose 4-epimerase